MGKEKVCSLSPGNAAVAPMILFSIVPTFALVQSPGSPYWTAQSRRESRIQGQRLPLFLPLPGPDPPLPLRHFTLLVALPYPKQLATGWYLNLLPTVSAVSSSSAPTGMGQCHQPILTRCHRCALWHVCNIWSWQYKHNVDAGPNRIRPTVTVTSAF